MVIGERFRSALTSFEQVLDCRRFVLLATITIWLAMLLGIFARAKPFWHDEVYTILTTQIPLGSLWPAYRDGVDLSPPLNTLLTRAVHAVTGVGLIATRLPAIAGYLTAIVVLFVTIRRRTNAVAGFTAALIRPSLLPGSTDSRPADMG
jgi:hypothetical protein